MPYSKRLTILHESEINDLYGIPSLSLEEKRISFALNDLEQGSIKSIRDRKHKCYAIALLGYFKIKPMQLNPTYKKLQEDLTFIAEEYFPQFKIPRFSVSRMRKARIYDKILNLLSFKTWNANQHQEPLIAYLLQVAKSWIEPRFLFDACTEYLSRNHIAIPKYTVLQQIISEVIKQERKRLSDALKTTISANLTDKLADLVDGESKLTLKELKQAAKSFNVSELEKELSVNELIQPWMNEVNQVVSALTLSQKNQQHYATMIDYYSITKLKRFDRVTQQLYLLCYLQERAQINIERLADGFIYHVRKLREKAKVYAKEMAYKDWEGAAANISKAAELLYFFIDDTIDEWETIQRIVISLQQKTLTQATLVRKLSGYSKNHPLLKALTEYNRMLKAMYLLDYIDDASLRSYVQRALNRGEAYHQLRRAIAHVNGNRFRGKNDDEINLWNECARLLTNAIIYFNSLILTRLLKHFEAEGDDKKLEIIKLVSPVAWHNINLNGTYSFSFEQNLLDLDEIMQSIVQNEN